MSCPKLAALVIFPAVAVLTAVPCLSASNSPTDDAHSVSELAKQVIKLERDVNTSVLSLGRTDPGQTNCLIILFNVLSGMTDRLGGLQDLIYLSPLMESAKDQDIVNSTIRFEVTEELKTLPIDRNSVGQQDPYCSQYPLVISYVRQIMSLIDEDTDMLGSIEQRLK
jgi:hypothetical protein